MPSFLSRRKRLPVGLIGIDAAFCLAVAAFSVTRRRELADHVAALGPALCHLPAVQRRGLVAHSAPGSTRPTTTSTAAAAATTTATTTASATTTSTSSSSSAPTGRRERGHYYRVSAKLGNAASLVSPTRPRYLDATRSGPS